MPSPTSTVSSSVVAAAAINDEIPGMHAFITERTLLQYMLFFFNSLKIVIRQ